jgi:UDP-glucose 4-epimerase
MPEPYLAGHERVVILDDLSSAARWNVADDARVRFIQGSILNEWDLRQAFAARPPLVDHLAALLANQNSIDHPEDVLLEICQ